jgi:hypothetical protein
MSPIAGPADCSQNHRRNRRRRLIQVPRRLRSLQRRRTAAGVVVEPLPAPPEPHRKPPAERCPAPDRTHPGPIASTGQALIDGRKNGGNSGREAIRILKRRLCDAIFQALVHDQTDAAGRLTEEQVTVLPTARSDVFATDAKSNDSSELALDGWGVADELDQVDGRPALGETD